MGKDRNFFEKISLHKGNQIRVLTDFYWYTREDPLDNVKNRICIILHAVEESVAMENNEIEISAFCRLIVKNPIWVLAQLYFDEMIAWIWLEESAVEFLQEETF
jgi:hypothetical protein